MDSLVHAVENLKIAVSSANNKLDAIESRIENYQKSIINPKQHVTSVLRLMKDIDEVKERVICLSKEMNKSIGANDDVLVKINMKLDSVSHRFDELKQKLLTK